MGVALIALLAGGGIVINHFANESSKTLVFQEEPVRLKLDQSYDHFEGWGTSLAWWANDLGLWKDQAKVSEVMDLVFDPEKGLGLNIVRYNIGGEENPEMKALRPAGMYLASSLNLESGTGRPMQASVPYYRDRWNAA